MNELPAHSKLGASSFHRWSACPGSVQLSAGLDSTSSVHAAEGTVAHALAANALMEDEDAVSIPVGTKILQDGHNIVVTEEMLDSIQVYLDTIRADACEDAGGAPLRLVEHKFHLKELHPQLFGTADCVQVWAGTKFMRVYDYKHGSGLAVDVYNNDQLKYYALGALLAHKTPVAEVELIIVQPRCPYRGGPVRRHRFRAVELLDFEADLMAAVRRTEQPEAPLKVGDHCRWCPAAGVCPEIRTRAQEAAKMEFSNNTPYSPQALADTLALLPAIEGWITTVREFAYGEAQHGRTPPGYKLVQKRPIRKWLVDHHTLECELSAIGLAESDIYAPREVKSPAQIEKVIGKGKKNAAKLVVVDSLCVRVSSGDKLVPESEPGEPVRCGAKEDFK